MVSDDNYPPYLFKGPDGETQGYLVDLWALWEQKTGTPVVLFNRYVPGLPASSVTSDNFEGGRAVAHLLAGGKQRLRLPACRRDPDLARARGPHHHRW